MGWLREHGLIACYQDYIDLPLGVLEDARMFMMAESAEFERQRRRSDARRR